MTLSKGIHLKGAGASATTITITGTISIQQATSRSFEMSGFAFRKSGGGAMFRVGGAWDAAPPLIHENVFTVSGAGIFRYETNGGVLYRNTFNGGWDDSGIQHKMSGDRQSWSSPDTMGSRDTTGRRNLYIEDNVFNGMPNGGTDFDDAARVVVRHNVFNSTSFNSHGLATSPVGVRHYEVYANEFRYPDASVNQNWMIWLRGGTGVFFDNTIDDIRGQQWGDKTEIRLSVRAADDGGQQGCCTTYPCAHQVGQNHDGSRQLPDPVRFWNNQGTQAWAISRFANSCGQDINDYLQNGRDFIFASSPKAGYTPFTYPHPARTDSAPKPLPPESLSVQ